LEFQDHPQVHHGTVPSRILRFNHRS